MIRRNEYSVCHYIKELNMQAIILAAGQGSRMNDPDGPPKVLLNLCGQILLEHQLNALSLVGVTSFVVVGGHQCDKIEEFATRQSLTRQFDLDVIHNDDWLVGNASSLLSARPYLRDERFVVVMGDHLFDSHGLHGFLKVRGDFIGVFDSAPRFVDVTEATKAASRNGHIIALGKELAEFKYIDTGIFVCSYRVFPFIEECLADGHGTFNEVKRRWIVQHDLHIFDCQGAFWMDVDTPEDLAKARELLQMKLMKPRDGWVARLLNRRLSIPLSRWLVSTTSITPNQISVMTFVLALVSAVLFCFGSGMLSILAGLLAQFASVIDGCDGEVARLRSMSTPYGAWLDAVLDRLADAALVSSMTYGAWQSDGAWWIWLVGFLALIGSFTVSYTEARYEGAFEQSPSFGDGVPAKRDMRLLLVMLGGITGQLVGALGLIAFLTVAEVIRRLWVITSQLQVRQAAAQHARAADLPESGRF